MSLSPLARNIQAARQAWGWSQERLAKALHCDQASISLWERDKIVPHGTSLVALACLCETTVEALLEATPKWHPPTAPASLPVFRD